jgi:hypothetical protein
MSRLDITRETLADGRLQLSAQRCSFIFERLHQGALLVTFTGSDNGQFGTAALDEIRIELLRHRPLELFVDARGATFVGTSVSKDWTHFFALNQEHLKRVSVLVGTKTMELTVAIAQHLSQTRQLIQIYSDSQLFDTRVATARG